MKMNQKGMSTTGIVFSIIGVIAGLSILGFVFGIFGEAQKVAHDELGPKAALVKYEWFIDQANRIEKMDQDVKLFDERITAIDTQYDSYGDDVSKWPPHIQMAYNKEKQQGREDKLAVVSQRNNLVRDYNASSEKFNWSPFQIRPDKPKERYHEYK